MNRCVRLCLLGLSISGCVSWEPTTISGPEAIPANRVIRVWTGTRSVQWRGVQVTGDSLTGVPSSASVTCKPCRTSMPLTAVDSTDSQSSHALPVILAAAPFIFLIASLLTYDSGPTGE